MKSTSFILAAVLLVSACGFTQAHQTDMNSKTALYHQQGKPPTKFSVLKEYPDKTVDLGIAPQGDEKEGTVVVGKCEVTTEARVGSCTLMTEAAKPDLKAMRAKAASLGADAKKAASDAEKAKGKPNEAELAAVAKMAQEAAEVAEAAVKDAESAAG